jgi:CBS domain-containing protein
MFGGDVMLVAETCTTDVVCCLPQTSVFEAARLMREKHVGDVVVVSDPEGERAPIGVVTDRDLAIEVLGRSRDAATTTLASLVRTPVVVARDSEDTRAVIERMHAHGVRRVPVVDARGALRGIVTLDDLLKTLLSDMQLLLEAEARAQRHEQTARR